MAGKQSFDGNNLLNQEKGDPVFDAQGKIVGMTLEGGQVVRPVMYQLPGGGSIVVYGELNGNLNGFTDKVIRTKTLDKNGRVVNLTTRDDNGLLSAINFSYNADGSLRDVVSSAQQADGSIKNVSIGQALASGNINNAAFKDAAGNFSLSKFLGISNSGLVNLGFSPASGPEGKFGLLASTAVHQIAHQLLTFFGNHKLATNFTLNFGGQQIAFSVTADGKQNHGFTVEDAKAIADANTAVQNGGGTAAQRALARSFTAEEMKQVEAALHGGFVDALSLDNKGDLAARIKNINQLKNKAFLDYIAKKAEAKPPTKEAFGFKETKTVNGETFVKDASGNFTVKLNRAEAKNQKLVNRNAEKQAEAIKKNPGAGAVRAHLKNVRKLEQRQNALIRGLGAAGALQFSLSVNDNGDISVSTQLTRQQVHYLASISASRGGLNQSEQLAYKANFVEVRHEVHDIKVDKFGRVSYKVNHYNAQGVSIYETTHYKGNGYRGEVIGDPEGAFASLSANGVSFSSDYSLFSQKIFNSLKGDAKVQQFLRKTGLDKKIDEVHAQIKALDGGFVGNDPNAANRIDNRNVTITAVPGGQLTANVEYKSQAEIQALIAADDAAVNARDKVFRGDNAAANKALARAIANPNAFVDAEKVSFSFDSQRGVSVSTRLENLAKDGSGYVISNGITDAAARADLNQRLGLISDQEGALGSNGLGQKHKLTVNISSSIFNKPGTATAAASEVGTLGVNVNLSRDQAAALLQGAQANPALLTEQDRSDLSHILRNSNYTADINFSLTGSAEKSIGISITSLNGINLNAIRLEATYQREAYIEKVQNDPTLNAAVQQERNNAADQREGAKAKAVDANQRAQDAKAKVQVAENLAKADPTKQGEVDKAKTELAKAEADLQIARQEYQAADRSVKQADEALGLSATETVKRDAESTKRYASTAGARAQAARIQVKDAQRAYQDAKTEMGRTPGN
ncbi:MAG: hypothetical protein KC649_02865, partial [Candidatus Omnitrophica bacterium]|nr:hypothetical protein [Candidatus Omnitrophota bacterium]